MNSAELALSIKEKARQLGFTLAGIVLPQAPVHLDVYLDWLEAGRYAGMVYLAEKRAVERRSDPALILPDCRSILILGIPYSSPQSQSVSTTVPGGRIAAYAWGADYHLVLPQRLQELVAFLEEQVGHPVPNRWYTDTGPILERDLAMRAGLGWIGKNTCLINPRHGSYFILAEILFGFDLPPDEPWTTDQCGSCSRCIVACPTNCILPDRTLDAARCISYQTIENKGGIPVDLRRLTGDWIFGCDICQMVCPWNIRFAQASGDPLFAPRPGVPNPVLVDEMALTPQEFNRKFKDSPLKRAKWRGYLRNVAIAAGNSGKAETLPVLEKSQGDSDPLVREAAQWAIGQVTQVTG
jgi:epoxyqueuosine reductase